MITTPRAVASRVKHWLFPRPAVAAWQHACREAQRVGRYVPGSIRLLDYTLRYPDLLTLCPQWHDLFVRETLRFRARGESPRVLDCGANVGLASLYFKRLYPRARITAYEADPAVCAILQDNLRANGAADVEAVQAAVWTENGRITFRCEGADAGTIDAFGDGLEGARQDVPSVRLRDVLKREPVDVLKLDIEGAELAVLRDCEDALGNVSTLLLDLHEFRPEERATPVVLDLLHRAGFTYALDELNSLPWRQPVAGLETPFPGCALCWAVLVRAWRS